MYNVPNIIDQILNRTISDIVGTDFTMTIPSANIIEHDHDYQIILAVPGLDKEDFKIKVEKNSLIVSADKEAISLPQDAKIKRNEFNFSKFRRSFNLSEAADSASIKAEYNDGILTITIDKKKDSEEAVKYVKID